MARWSRDPLCVGCEMKSGIVVAHRGLSPFLRDPRSVALRRWHRQNERGGSYRVALFVSVT